MEYISLSSGPRPVAPCPVEKLTISIALQVRVSACSPSFYRTSQGHRDTIVSGVMIHSPSESDASVRCVTYRSYEFPINIPVANTSAPPNATCMAAERDGVSMKR